jgi:hypothetical protein
MALYRQCHFRSLVDNPCNLCRLFEYGHMAGRKSGCYRAIFFAADSSIAGGSIRWCVEMTAHVGLVFHAATVSFSSNMGP